MPRPNRYRTGFLAFGTALLLGSPHAFAADTLPGPVEARVLRVIDGDTFEAEAHIWPGQTITVNIRLRGIDAPEIRGRCEAEKAAGKRSREALEKLIGGATVQIRNVGGGKYYGRVLADATTHTGHPLADYLLQRSLARSYAGGKRQSLCG